MKHDVLRISRICYAQAIAACGEQVVKSKAIREIRFNSLLNRKSEDGKLQLLITN